MLISSSVAIWSIYNQIVEWQNQVNGATNQVKITDISINARWGNPVGVTYDRWFNVTVENRGMTNVSGLVLDVKLVNYSGFDFGIGCPEPTYEGNFSLAAGEVRIFQGFILAPLNSSLVGGRFTDVFIEATVMQDNVALNTTRKAF